MTTPAADTVTLAAQPRKVLLLLLPWLLVILPLLGLVILLKLAPDNACAQLFGLPNAYWALLIATRGLPLLLLAGSLVLVPGALKTIRSGYYPALDSIRLRPTVARHGRLSVLRGYGLLLMPVLAIGILLVGDRAYSDVMNGRSVADVTQAIAAGCSAPADR
ncbi:hypothetical protein IB229_00810 [Pseudomonas sp. PDM14]|uniref:hypothetical protein n=1 Tax=Pseudomonas sp. PDM14 TaxID=2769288 RepID=UPI00178670F1|nr:hypothetical protein [Pseudomonas sp. PDM14]MBD9481497.1 hypothetical protein [Pseudomonas sp. PDM14]